MNLSEFKKKPALSFAVGEDVATKNSSDQVKNVVNLNLSNPSSIAKNPKVKKKRFFNINRVVSFFLLLIFIGAGSGGAYYYNNVIKPLQDTGIENINVFTPFKSIINAVAVEKNPLDSLKQASGKTNVLLLGIDARGSYGSLLTDSIIIVSYDHKTKETAQISIPRDMEAKYKINNVSQNSKINAVFPLTYGNAKTKGTEQESVNAGFQNLGTVIENITGLPIHYGLMINFQGLKEIVDNVGGINVDVENTFTDYAYPTENYGYMTVSFKKGQQFMNGTKALQFARSRHSEDNGEGSDYMRARRQQRIINAVKEKIYASTLIDKAEFVPNMIKTLSKNVKFYNISDQEIDIAIQAKDELRAIKTFSLVLEPGFGSFSGQLLRAGDQGDGRGFILAPTDKTYAELKNLINIYLENGYLVSEDPNPKLFWTNATRYKDFIKARNIFEDQGLKYTFIASSFKIATTATQAITPTVVNPAKSFGTIYTLNDSKVKSLEYYKSLFAGQSLTLVQKQGSELPKEISQYTTGSDFIIVID